MATTGTALEKESKSAAFGSAAKEDLETPVDVKTAAGFLGVSPSLVYSWVERKQIPHFRIMGRAIRFSIPELAQWRQQFHVSGGIDEQ